MTDQASENLAVGMRLKDLLLQKQVLMTTPESMILKQENPEYLKQRIQALETENQNLSNTIARLREKADALEDQQVRLVTDAFSQAVDYLKSDQFLDALGCLQAVLILDPNHPSARINLAVAYAALDHEDRAAAELEQVLQIDPDNETAKRNLAVLRAS